MSYTTLLAAKEDGVLFQLARYGNAWGYQPLVWDMLYEKYKHEIDKDVVPPQFEMFTAKWERLFKWINNGGKTHPADMNVVAMSFPGNYLHGKEDIERQVESLRRLDEYPRVQNRISHFAEIAKDMKRGLDEGHQWITFYGNSVDANPWVVRDHEDDDGREYNFKTDLDVVLDDLTCKAARIRQRSLDSEPVSFGELLLDPP